MAKKNSVKKVFPSVFIFIAVFILIISNIHNKCSKTGKNKNSEENINHKASYVIKFDDNFNKSLSVKDDLGLSILIAVDCSGSMSDVLSSTGSSGKKYQIASRSLTEIISFFDNFYKTNIKKENIILKIGLLKFSDDVQPLFDLSEMNEVNFKKLKAITSDINNFMPQGKTCIGTVLDRGTQILSQSGTIFKSLIVITDGQNTTGPEPGIVLKAIVNNYNNKSTEDMKIITSNILVSLIGFDLNASQFEGLNRDGARIMTAMSKEELNNSLINLFMSDITKFEAK